MLFFLVFCSGAEVDHESGSGRTPLHEASEAGHNGITELLVKEGGADPILRDQNDATPYDLAFNKGYKEVCVCVCLCAYVCMPVCLCVLMCVCLCAYVCLMPGSTGHADITECDPRVGPALLPHLLSQHPLSSDGNLSHF